MKVQWLRTQNSQNTPWTGGECENTAGHLDWTREGPKYSFDFSCSGAMRELMTTWDNFLLQWCIATARPNPSNQKYCFNYTWSCFQVKLHLNGQNSRKAEVIRWFYSNLQQQTTATFSASGLLERRVISCTAKPIKFKILSRLKQVYHGGRHAKRLKINAREAVKQLFPKRALWKENSGWSKAIRLGQEVHEWHWRTISGRFRQNADFLKMTRANKTMRIQEVDDNSFLNWPHSIFGQYSWQQLWPCHNDKKPKHAKGVCKSVPQQLQHWCHAQQCSPVALNLSSRIHGSSWASG